MMRLSRYTLGAIIAAASLLTAAPSVAQDASPFLPADHWALEAVRRLDASGAVGPGVDPVSRSLTVAEAFDWLQQAGEASPPALARRARAYAERLADELGGRSPDDTPFLMGEGFLGYGATSGVLEPGSGSWGLEGWTGPRPLPDLRGPRGELRLSADAGPRLAVGLSARATGSEVSVEEAYLVSAVSAVGLWLGRKPVGYRVGRGGGVVLDSVRMDGLGLFLTRPLDLPLVEAVRLETDLARVDDNGWVGRPWVWSSRASLQPHPRLGVGATRAIMFGGDRNEPVTLRNVLYMIVGKHGGSGSGFENQVASVDIRYRPPLPAPVVLRLEWGFDDSAGAWFDQPAVVAGAELAAVPGIPGLAFGLEHTRIAGAVQGHSIWYRHWWFHDGWVADGASLGHPLGGHGREWLLYGTGDLVERGLRVDARLFLRDRGEFNVFAPDRAGRSTGVLVEAEWRVSSHLELLSGGLWEGGETGWRESALRIGGRLRTGVGLP